MNDTDNEFTLKHKYTFTNVCMFQHLIDFKILILFLYNNLTINNLNVTQIGNRFKGLNMHDKLSINFGQYYISALRYSKLYSYTIYSPPHVTWESR
jgi:hypothetical protein